MLNVNAFEKHVVARILDFFDSKAPWQRGLWEAGVALRRAESKFGATTPFRRVDLSRGKG